MPYEPGTPNDPKETPPVPGGQPSDLDAQTPPEPEKDQPNDQSIRDWASI